MRIHLIGVCGTAMATLAALLQRRGHDVQGSDQNVYPPMSDFLAAEGIRTFAGYAAEHIGDDVDLVVVGTPIDLTRVIKMNKPHQRVRYELQEIGQPTLEEILKAKFAKK